MLHRLLSLLGLAQTPAGEEPGRSPKWPAVRKAHLKAHPTCAACGGKDHLQCHHIQPFHLFLELELIESNLLTLCESPGHNCHLTFGHAYDFQAWNPTAVEDATWWLARVQSRLYGPEEPR